MSKKIVRSAVAAIGVLISSASAQAETMIFKATLDGAEQVPPVTTTATGTANVTYDTMSKVLGWSVDYSGLSGDVKAAHFHGPAAKGENAKPVVPINVGDLKKGAVTLTDEQAAELESGKMYLNIHTAKYPDGEIRGQVVPAK